MCIYTYLEFFFLLLLCVELIGDNYKMKKMIFLCCAFLLICLLGFRANTVGADTPNYVKMFLNQDGPYGTINNPEEEIESGIYYIAYAIRLFSDEYWVWHLSTSFFLLLPFLLCIDKYSYIKSLPFFIYLAFNWSLLYLGLTIMRQNLSVAFFLYAVVLYIKSGYRHYYMQTLLCFSALFLHRATLLPIIFFLIINHLKFNKKIVIACLILSIFGGMLIERTLYDFIQYVNIITANSGVERFADYDKDSFESSVNFNRLGPATIYVLMVVLSSHKEAFKDIRLRFLIIGCVMYNLAASISVAMRLVYPFILLGITYVPKSLFIRRNIIPQIIVALILLFFMYLNTKKYDGKNDYDNTYPYTFFWEK